jgi:hypothetical protein
MPALCQAADWGIVDDTPFVLAAIREWNFRQLACTKPAKSFSELPVSGQSWVMMKAAQLKLDAQG